ncbi:type II toxin-antitoxin system HicB family antitoxin [Paenibacillus sanguinis]|uniref:type II toxin-antitoxin system HicB family antitoxin n=1 Tax=Paenibacillus sanguinis TaxID=225906 RepID=UPI001969E5FB|nr:type II toxin-antitoxin system HicB family antitoxin [Paenibacillus sanguinis]
MQFSTLLRMELISLFQFYLDVCITCGCTIEEAMKMAKEALKLYFDDVTQDNIPNGTEIDSTTLKLSEKVLFSRSRGETWRQLKIKLFCYLRNQNSRGR